MSDETDNKGMSDETDTKTGAAEVATTVATPDASQEGIDGLDAGLPGLRIGASAQNIHTYSMSNKTRGKFIIINNRRFQAKTGMGERSGTDMDAANLHQRFKELGFDVQLYNNLTCVHMLKVFTEAARADYSDADCFACAILSHGDEGVVYGVDDMIELDSLINPFKGNGCVSLLGKPKIFIIQACRGNLLDHGAMVRADADTDEKEKVYRIPTEADFLYAYSTVAGYFSWRNSTKGSWFIQALCRILKEHGRTKDIMWILTRVNYEVAYEFESNASRESMTRKKQIPSIVSMLTKELIFNKK